MKKRKKDKYSGNAKPVNDIIGLWEASMEFDPSDTLGSYTGTPYDAFEEDDYQPVQDADDL